MASQDLKYRYMTTDQLKREAKEFFRTADDAGFNALDAIELLGMENPDLDYHLRINQISRVDLWRAMRVEKIDAEDKGGK